MALLGVDVGSSGVKAAVFREDGTIVAQGTQSYQPTVLTAHRAEMDTDVLLDAFFKAVRYAAVQTTERVEALAVSSHGESFAALAPDGAVLGNMVLNADNRAQKQSDRLAQEFGRSKLYEMTGVPVHPMFGLMKIMHGMQEGAYDRDTRFLNAGDFILHRLGVEPYTDYSLAGRMFGLNLQTKAFDPDLLKAAGLKEEQMPRTVQAGTIAGTLSGRICGLTGLPDGVKVVVGGHDQACGAFGSGTVTSGASISAGTYESIVCATDRLFNNEKAMEYALNSFCHVVPGQYGIMAFYPAGYAVRWIVEQLFEADRARAEEAGMSVYEWLEVRAGQITGPSGVHLTPHLVGACNPHWDARATGVIAGITPNITRYHLYKAVYEGIACELAQNMKALETVGVTIDSCNISGGGSKSAFTVQLRASLCGKTICRLTTSEAVCQGAAMLAGVGIGIFSDYEEAKSSMVHVLDSAAPDVEQGREYGPQLKQYETLYRNLAEYRKGCLI